MNRNMLCGRQPELYMGNMCVQRNSQIHTLIKQLLAKYRFFKKLTQISHIHKKL